MPSRCQPWCPSPQGGAFERLVWISQWAISWFRVDDSEVEKKKERNKDKDDKLNGGSTLDPYASDDEDNLRRIATSFESKYGTPKKKCRRLEDYTELGTGYDESDSFIDNTDAYDEVVPEDQTPELDGFYINKGHLILKRVDGRSSSDHSDSEESEGPQNIKSHKRPLSSESESGSSESSDDSDDSDDSEDSEEDDDEEEADTEIPKETKSNPKEVKEEKSNGHGSIPASKKPKLLDTSSKKVKNKAICGVFLKKAVSEREHNEKRLKHDMFEMASTEKRVSNNISVKTQSEKHCNLESDVKPISTIDAAIEAVARGEDSKESGIAESKSHSGSSDESGSDENGKVNGQSNGAMRVAPPLPSDLPPNVMSVISALKEVAVKNSSLNKNNFFTSEINALLLKFEKFLRFVPREKKAGIYEHLEFYLPCRKETLIKRGKALLIEGVEKGYKEPLLRLKIGITNLMPNAMERYQSMCRKYESLESSADPTDASKPADKTKTPRRRFPWTDELKDVFVRAVRKRKVYFGTVKQKDEVWEDHLREFLKNELVPMWEPGWMKLASLLDIISKISPDLLQFKPPSMNSDDLKKNLVCPTKKPAIKVKQSCDDMKVETSAKKMSSSPINISGNSKPLQSVNHQQAFINTQQVSSSEVGVKHEVPVNSSRTASSVSLMQSSIFPSSNQTNALDLLGNEIAETLRTSLANSLVSVTPVQSSSSHLSQSNIHSSISSRKSLGSSVDIINLKTNGIDSSIEVVPKKRSPAAPSATQSGQHNPSVVQPLNMDLQFLPKSQSASISIASPTQTTQQLPYHSSTSHNQIKVSSVSAINLKLSGPQSQAQSHPSSNKPNMAQPPSTKANMAPPSSKANMTQPQFNKSNMTQPPLSKANMTLPPPSKATMSQTPLNMTNMPQPPSSKSNLAQLPINKTNLAQPPSSKANISGKSSMPQPTSCKTSMSQPPSSKASLSQPLKSNNHLMSGHQGTGSFSGQSVISHGLEPTSLVVSSSLTITPVRPSSSNAYYQPAKTQGHSTIQSSISSIVSHGNPNVRSEVIVTPSSSSSMPHIKSTNANFSVSSAGSVSSSSSYTSPLSSVNNFSPSYSGSVNNFTNSRGGGGGNAYQNTHVTGGNGFSSSLSSSDTSVRTHRTVANDASISRNHSADKSVYSQSSRNQVPDKAPHMWSAPGPLDVSRSPSSSPISVKAVTPSPEKAMVSRKDRILQETRERPGNDPMMPTLSGPYRNSITTSDASNTARNLSQAKASSQSLPWDDELFILEDFLKMSSQSSSTPQNTHKVSTATMDSYKHPLSVLESQRCDNIPNKSPLLDPPRPKNLTVPTPSDQQRANVVMHTPYAHNSSKSSSLGFMQHPRDQPRSNAIISNHVARDLSRPSSTKSSSNPDSQRANVVMATPHFQESLRASSLKDEMNDILAGIPTQMISRTDHYTITNSMAAHNAKRKSISEISDQDSDVAIGSTTSMRSDPKNLASQEESRQKAHDLAMRGILMSRTNCDDNYSDDAWGAAPVKKTGSNKSSNDISDQRLGGMGPLSSPLSMTGLDDMGLGLPSHLLGYQNDYQRHLYGSSSKTTGPNDNRPL
ncbi:ubinuclein-1 isoform X2 [Thrips palmi]|uniref:Ubinuclein-1 isoform X2 n=1 Tax=Thrips palmi TaxID=161013 RepID=A0A6P9A3F4_THRPL|nr:ubinuclein-1 isoform X2 [Thrips palmi]